MAALLAVISLVVAACAGDAGAPVDTTTSLPRTSVVDEATRPPEVDLSVHSVPLDEIHFDTFDGGSVLLSESTPELRRSLLDAIPPIDGPVYGDVAGLAPSDLVLGYVADGQARAYPVDGLTDVINDYRSSSATCAHHPHLARRLKTGD